MNDASPPISAARSLAALCCAAVLGCSTAEETQLSAYLEELEFEAPLESVVDVPLGTYRIPLAVRVSDDLSEPPTWMRLSFTLLAETSPDDRRAIEDALERYDGPLRDAVLTACRKTTPDELNDPRLSAMKARLADATKPILGERRVRQLIIRDYVDEAL